MRSINLFIDEFGRENFIVILAIVLVVIAILFLILFLERRGAKKAIKQEINTINENKVDDNTEVVEHLDKKSDVLDNSHEEVIDEQEEGQVFYVKTENEQEEAKEKLEEVTKRLIDEEIHESSDLIDHTHFENEQEEDSIISYEELVNASHNIDEKNDRVLRDEDEAAITIEELYKKHEEEQNVVEHSISKETKVNNPVFEEEHKGFKNSEVISPVFGVYNGKIKEKNTDVLKEINKTVSPKDLEDEIERTEDFLEELKRLKNRLD